MVIVLAVLCALLALSHGVTSRRHRHRLRARQELAEEIMAKTWAIEAEHETFREEYLAMAADHRRQYTQLGARLEASYADQLARAEQRWAAQITAIQGDYDDSLARLRAQHSTALVRLQRRMPAPEVLRLYGDQLL